LRFHPLATKSTAANGGRLTIFWLSVDKVLLGDRSREARN
jgi:hypothetical protein